MLTFTYMFPSTWPFLKDDVSTCLGKPPRFDFATKKGGNETDAKLADPIAGAESGSCQLSESSMVIYELNKMWCVMLMDLKRYFWNLMNITFFFYHKMETNGEKWISDLWRQIDYIKYGSVENGVYPNMASVGKMVP